MSFSDFVTHSGKRICREHYNHLVQASKVEGKISNEAMGMLREKGRKFGLTDPEINKIIESETHYQYIPPYSLIGKFIHIYNLAQIVLADDIVTENEMKLLKKFFLESGFNDKIETLLDLVIEGIRKDEEEDKLFEKFKRTHFSRK
jgi:hypothetical protein